MEKLQKEVKRIGMTFEQVTRCDHAAIYREKNRGQYEVFYIEILPEGEVFGKHYLERESYPCTEEFGKTAWCINDKLRAFAKYYQLRDNPKEKK